MPRILWLFALVNLIVGSGAFVLGGILDPLARSLGTSVPAAGQAMTAYALATAVLAPAAMVLGARWRRKTALLAAVGVFGLGNLLCALAGSLPALLAGRVLMGVGAVFTPLAAGLAVALVAPALRGKALATVFLGMSLSYAVGVPLGTWLGLAHGWRVPVWGAVAASAVAWLALARFVPADVQAPSPAFSGLAPVLRRPDVLAVLLLTLLYFVAIFAVFSYVGPVLQALVPMSAERQSVTLALFGCSGVVGTLVGGAASDRFGALPTLRVQLVVLAATMALLPLTQGSWPLLMAVLLAWGTAGFGMMVPQQSRLATLAPAQAPLLLSLNTSMLYLGTAAGAVVGGAAAVHLGLAQLGWAGLPFVACGLAILWLARTSAPAATAGRIDQEIAR
jgi:MFS transporter, DHA1 family, inner membrane transport protein